MCSLKLIALFKIKACFREQMWPFRSFENENENPLCFAKHVNFSTKFGNILRSARKFSGYFFHVDIITFCAPRFTYHCKLKYTILKRTRKNNINVSVSLSFQKTIPPEMQIRCKCTTNYIMISTGTLSDANFIRWTDPKKCCCFSGSEYVTIIDDRDNDMCNLVKIFNIMYPVFIICIQYLTH